MRRSGAKSNRLRGAWKFCSPLPKLGQEAGGARGKGVLAAQPWQANHRPQSLTPESLTAAEPHPNPLLTKEKGQEGNGASSNLETETTTDTEATETNENTRGLAPGPTNLPRAGGKTPQGICPRLCGANTKHQLLETTNDG